MTLVADKWKLSAPGGNKLSALTFDAHSGGYNAPIKRLRWKDHRNMAMRGEDVIGILQDP